MSTPSQQNSNQWKCFNNAEVQTRFHQIYTSPSGKHQNYVPFLGKVNRFATNKHHQPNPPIGSYNLPSCFDRKKSYLQDRVNHFLIQAQKKKEQMSIFKSSMNRFQKVVKNVPGPASYNLFKKNSEVKEKINRNSLGSQQNEKKNDFGKKCPSIPHKQNKYGYSINNGQIKNIEKNEDIIEKEKQFRKQYLATLDQQKIMKDSRFFNHYNHLDQKKKLYGKTQQLVYSKSQSQKNISKTLLSFKKPKYQHLYHSKGVEASASHENLGPGAYQISQNSFNVDSKKQQHQFFGSTQVRFKDKTNFPEKGYSLIEMVKQKKKLVIKDTRPSPIKRTVEPKQNLYPETVMPGPGQYNPNDQIFKKTRGKAFFPNTQRFQGMYAKPEEIYQQEEPDEEYAHKKSPKVGKLKKERFKPLQKVYSPVNSAQICGILSEKTQVKGKQAKRNHKKLQIEENQIKCWSRQGKREDGGNQYMKELKQQLAFINETPSGGFIKKDEIKRNKNHKKE